MKIEDLPIVTSKNVELEKKKELDNEENDRNQINDSKGNSADYSKELNRKRKNMRTCIFVMINFRKI